MTSTKNPALNHITFCEKCNDESTMRQKTEIPYSNEILADNISRHKLNVEKDCEECNNTIEEGTFIYAIEDREQSAKEGKFIVQQICLECFKEYIQNHEAQSEVIAEIL